MNIYCNKIKGFLKDIEPLSNAIKNNNFSTSDENEQTIEETIEETIIGTLSRRIKESGNLKVSKSEKNSWSSSLPMFAKILESTKIPDNIIVTLEYELPNPEGSRDKRVDVIITGYASDHSPQIILFELKQWTKLENVDYEDTSGKIIFRKVQDANKNEWQSPDDQVIEYRNLLHNKLKDKSVTIWTCVYLYNAEDSDLQVIKEHVYKFNKNERNLIIAGKKDTQKIRKLIEENIRTPDSFLEGESEIIH